MNTNNARRRLKFLAIHSELEQRKADMVDIDRSSHAVGRGGKVKRGWAKAIRITSDGNALHHWREKVLSRDGHKCVHCGSTAELEADRIKPKVLYPDLKYDVSNGRTLCFPCHSKTETYGGRVHRIVDVAID